MITSLLEPPLHLFHHLLQVEANPLAWWGNGVRMAGGDLDKIKRSLEVAVIGYRKILTDPKFSTERSTENVLDNCFSYANTLLSS
jgi:hypothetical protein